MTPAEKFLSRVEGVRRTGPGRWLACCPAHDDKRPSLSIRELEDERILVKCWTGCSAAEVVAALGLSMESLFPERNLAGRHSIAGERRPFPAADVLRAVAFEALVVAAAGAALLSGQSFSATDRERLIVAVSRIQAALTASGVRHDT